MDAASAVGRLGDPKAIDALIKISESRSTWLDTRISCIRSIGIIGGEKAIETLKKLEKYEDLYGPAGVEEAIQKAAKLGLNRPLGI